MRESKRNIKIWGFPDGWIRSKLGQTWRFPSPPRVPDERVKRFMHSRPHINEDMRQRCLLLRLRPFSSTSYVLHESSF